MADPSIYCLEDLCFTKDDFNRFWTLVQVGLEDECWCFGKQNKHRATFAASIGVVKVPRVMFILVYGSIPKDKPCVCHTCDHPWCCNPRHFFAGTHQDNMADKLAKDRQPRGDQHWFHLHPELNQGEKCGRAKLTTEKIMLIFLMKKSGKYTQQQIADKFDISQVQVSLILNGKSWKHLKLVESGK